MVEVLFGQAYYLRFDPKLWASRQPYAPLGTLFAASYLRARGFEVALFDAMLAESESEWADALDRHRPRWAIIYEDNFNYLSKMCLSRMREAALAMIRMAKARGITTIVAGSDATDHVAVYTEAGAAYVLLGEGEHTLGDLMERLRASRSAAGLVGLAHAETGVVEIGARRPVIKELDALPLPAWDLVDVERYRRVWMERHGYFSMNMVTTRGCPYHCNWCAKPLWGQRYNSRSPENVVEEIRLLHARYRPDHLWFMDDILGLKPGWLERFAALLAEAGLRVPFKGLSRADLLLRGDTIDALARAGCKTMWIGAESGSQKILDAMEKGTKVEEIHEATRRLRAAGIEVGFFVQFGYPGEGRREIDATFEMVRALLPEEIGISVSYPLPGTRFYDAVRAELGEKKHWVDSSDLDMMYEGPFATPFYRQLHRVLHQEHRARLTLSRLRRERRGVRADAEDVARAAFKLLRLPLERRRLEKLSRLPHRPTAISRRPMSLDAAATPSPQEE